MTTRSAEQRSESPEAAARGECHQTLIYGGLSAAQRQRFWPARWDLGKAVLRDYVNATIGFQERDSYPFRSNSRLAP